MGVAAVIAGIIVLIIVCAFTIAHCVLREMAAMDRENEPEPTENQVGWPL